MALPFKVAREHLPAALRFFAGQAGQFVRDRVLRRPSRPQQALSFVRAEATEGDPDSVLAALDRFGREHAFLMNVGDRKGEILDRALRESGARRCLELGAFCGYSAVRMGRILREHGGRLVSLEASAANARVAQAVVAFAGLEAQVEIRIGKAEELIPGLEGPFELVFLDHWKDLYLPDLRRIEDQGLLRPGSVVVADNVGFFDSSEYLAYVRGSGRYDSVHHASTLEYRDDIPDAVEVSTLR